MIICPICKSQLERIDNTYKCPNNHSYDIAKSGYVNLLLNKSQSGDNKEMVDARVSFLDKDFYKPLSDAVIKAMDIYLDKDSCVLDLGCGTGYYTNNISQVYNNIIGIDISSDAAKKASKKAKDANILVASASNIPLSDHSIDMIYHIFSPIFLEEEKRVLKEHGYLLSVTAGVDHLIELKKAIYDNPYLNDNEHITYDGFPCLYYHDVSYKCLLEKDDILNLVKMTPYFYKTSKEDLAKLDNINSLDVTFNFKICIYIEKSI